VRSPTRYLPGRARDRPLDHPALEVRRPGIRHGHAARL